MLVSTLTLVLGFSVFGLSNFFVNVTLGLLTALVFSLGLVWDLLATPSLMMLLHPHVSRQRQNAGAFSPVRSNDLAIEQAKSH
jgi:predicted RND superfamily exporter protein